jgi:hypothetical protein
VDDSHAPFSSGGALSGFTDASGLALQEQTRTLWMKDALPEPVEPEQNVTLNGESWTVQAVAVEDGILKITLTRGYSS